ncbi:hypothetical protein DPMN_080549 [Dreissena polymorpha]|uniref:Uncharacterized protein n=1 Tax=Dreissena polymorpha TaxID=45954 RepID=A0A9D3YVC6_DREPO|nr:hypothetical protein DPMN_080549 [Dreissena polymorpha]
MLQVPLAHRRNTEQSLCHVVLSRQLLNSYEAAREIDLRVVENPCPATCVCRSIRNMLQISPTSRRRTDQPLYRVVLSQTGLSKTASSIDAAGGGSARTERI